MSWYEEMTWCDSCGVEITWAPVILEGRVFCCRDCAEGRVCQCDSPPEEEHKGSDAVVQVSYALE